MGWLMAMFDLPVILDEERKEAARFRKALLDDGFIMIQYSVYSRPCVSLERMAKYYEAQNFGTQESENGKILRTCKILRSDDRRS